jgi:hypothetical protein
MWHWAVWQKFIDVLEEHTASIFMAAQCAKQATSGGLYVLPASSWLLTWPTFWPSRWRLHIPPQHHWTSAELHSITYLKTVLFIHTNVRTLTNLTNRLHRAESFSRSQYGTQRFSIVFTTACLSLSWARWIQSTTHHPTSPKSNLILSSHLYLCLHSGLFLSGILTKTLYPRLSHSCYKSSFTWSL